MRIGVTLFRALLLSLLEGCSTPIVILPDDIGSDGLLVGQVASTTWPSVSNGSPKVVGADPPHGTKKYIGGQRANTIAIPLRPGEYTLTGFDETTATSSYSYGYGTATTRYYRWYPVHRTFTIESGKATNIGLIVFEPLGPPGTAIAPVYLDNTAEVATYLRERYPKMIASLKEPKFITAAENPLTGSALERLRIFLAAQRVRSRRWQYAHAQDEIITSTAGTMMWALRNKQGQYVPKTLFDTGTVTDLSRCAVHRDRAICIIARDTYLLAERDTLVKRQAPAGVVLDSAAVFGEHGIVLVDDYARLRTSLDNGASWSLFEGAAKKEPVRRDGYDPIDVNSFGVHIFNGGFYLFEKNADGDKAPLIHGDQRTGAYRLIRLPRSVENVRVLKQTERGLFVGPASTQFAKDSLHLLSARSGAWSEIPLPRAYCHDMAIEDGQGMRIEVLCGETDVRRSDDGGATWARRELTHSLFAP